MVEPSRPCFTTSLRFRHPTLSPGQTLWTGAFHGARTVSGRACNGYITSAPNIVLEFTGGEHRTARTRLMPNFVAAFSWVVDVAAVLTR
jgi:hypothetical protein